MEWLCTHGVARGLLEANPLEDVAAASKIAGVLIRGRWIGAEEIESRMREIAASVDGKAR